ncbi:hypothetical protein [Yinghuangia aomiensis]
MPTPHGDHGLAFGMPEVRLLRRALRIAMKSDPGSGAAADPAAASDAPTASAFWLLDRAIAEAEAERDRLRAFHLAELDLQRRAVPGSAATYLSALSRAVDAYAHIPTAADLAALRAIAELPCSPRERSRRDTLLAYCTDLADRALDARLTAEARRKAGRPRCAG